VGVSLEAILWHVRRRFGLAAAVFYFERWLKVRATHNGSSLVLQHPREASCADSQAREAVVWAGGGGVLL
jgi:hypothetical protein